MTYRTTIVGIREAEAEAACAAELRRLGAPSNLLWYKTDDGWHGVCSLRDPKGPGRGGLGPTKTAALVALLERLGSMGRAS